MTIHDNYYLCAVICLIIGINLSGCSIDRMNHLEVSEQTQPPKELVALLSREKRLIRIFSLSHSFDSETADYFVEETLMGWTNAPFGVWPDYSEKSDLYRHLTATRYNYQGSYLYQLRSKDTDVIPMAIIVPKAQGIIVLLNPFEPEYGIPWECDHLMGINESKSVE